MDDEELYSFSQRHANLRLVWTVDLYGKQYPTTIGQIDLSDAAVKDLSALEEKLKFFSSSPTVNLSDRKLDVAKLEKLHQSNPDAFVLCNVELGGETFRTDQRMRIMRLPPITATRSPCGRVTAI